MSKRLAFPREEYVGRVRRVEAALERAGYDALIGYSVRNAPGPVVYLGGYEPCLGLHDVAFFTVVPGGRPRCALLTNAFWDHPQERTWVDDVIITSDFEARLVELLPGSSRRIGIAGYRFFPTPVYKALQAAFPAACIEDAAPQLLKVARVKSSREIEVMRQCMAITDEGGRAFLASIREGANEREIQAETERAVMLAGADGLSYGTQVYSGPQVAVGIGFRTGRTLALGEQVQVDVGAIYWGYRGDLSRVTTVGRPSPEVRAIMETTAQMYEAMLRAVRPGAMVAEVAEAALAVARAGGMEPYLYRSPNHGVGFLGHGIGCWYHGPPEIRADAEEALETNMVVVLEPILGHPGVGGAKIEDPVLVTSHGAERLSNLELRTWPE
jgi:Xaa-Pro dipeptidase